MVLIGFREKDTVLEFRPGKGKGENTASARFNRGHVVIISMQRERSCRRKVQAAMKEESKRIDVDDGGDEDDANSSD